MLGDLYPRGVRDRVRGRAGVKGREDELGREGECLRTGERSVGERGRAGTEYFSLSADSLE